MNEKVIDSSNDLGIVISGGTQNSSLNIQGTELNNTIVTCIASGLVDMMGYLNTSSATLFIQGMWILIMEHIKCNNEIDINIHYR